MSTATEHQHQHGHTEPLDHIKKEHSSVSINQSGMMQNGSDKQQHPLHQYDLSIMSKLYETCIGKAISEQMPKWKPDEWVHSKPMPHDLPIERKHEWNNPVLVGQKQKVYESFARLARETGEPMILMPSFDFGDMINFERFLDALKLDGINAIGKYKQYLNSRDIRKFEVDLVVIHPVHGIILVEVKESDLFDNKKRSRARMHLNAARQSFEAILRLILESKGLKLSDSQIPVQQFVALPNVRELPVYSSLQNQQKTASSVNSADSNGANTSSSSIDSVSGGRGGMARSNRVVNYLIKSDLDDQAEFAKWFNRALTQPSIAAAEAKKEEDKEKREREEREKREREEKREENKEKEKEKEKEKMSKQDLLNQMMGLITCIRSNSILPVVYPESGAENGNSYVYDSPEKHHSSESKDKESESEKDKEEKEKQHLNQPALNVYAEFFRAEHEKARALSKCVVQSRDSEKIRRTICLQALWLLLNDSQKKISVVTTEVNKPFYEEFFARQRKVYNNLNNLRFYVDIHSCDPSQHTLKRDGEIWFFDSSLNASLSDILTRVKDLPSYWIFSENADQVREHNHELSQLNAKHCNLDKEDECAQRRRHDQMLHAPENRIKLPLRLVCDLLIVGDMIGVSQIKYLYKYLKSNTVLNQAHAYQSGSGNNRDHHQQQYQQLKFNPMKKFRTVKFVRGGTIDNLRTSLKMHDSIQAPVILMHVGDEDLFKTRYSVATIERIKELTTLVKEYCPKSFVVLSTLMRRLSRTENSATNEVNKGITSFCKQTKESLNVHYMLNNHFEPDYHTQGGRLLTGKGLKLFADNLLFTVDYFLVRNNKQH